MAADPEPEQRRLSTIMFTDMVGYSALSQKNETLALELLEEHRRLLRAAFARHGGREIEAVGDGFFVEFASALAGARCAVEIQTALRDRNATAPSERGIQVRIGLHLGDVVYLGPHVHGDGVNIAARIEPLAAPGGICLSEDVARQVQNKIELPLRKLGKGALKNIQMPVDIYRLVLPGERARLPFWERVAFGLRRRRTRRVTAGVLVLLLVATGGGYLWRREARGRGDGKRIAVLPFANLSVDAENEYFADGMTEELISRLSRIRGLEVIARTSVMKYKGARKDVADVGRELNVGSVLEGSVRKAGDTVRISAQLISVQNQAHLWSEDYDRELKNVFAVQTDIAQEVAEALRVRLSAAEQQQVAKRGTESPDAYMAYLQGRYFWSQRTKAALVKAIAYFRDAIARDPKYAQAYAGEADAYTALGFYQFLLPRETYPRAKTAALAALEIDDALSEAHTSVAAVRFWYEWDWPGAEEAFKRALALNPSYAVAHQWYAWYLMHMGRFEDAIVESRRARELDPLSLTAQVTLGGVLVQARQYDRAVEQLRKILDLEPTFFPAHRWLGITFVRTGRHGDAIAELKKVVELTSNAPAYVADLGWGYGMTGQRVEARKVLEELSARSKKEYVPADAFAWIYLGLGDTDRAFEWLRRSVEERSPAVLALKVDASVDSLRSDPRFAQLLKTVGLER